MEDEGVVGAGGVAEGEGGAHEGRASTKIRAASWARRQASGRSHFEVSRSSTRLLMARTSTRGTPCIQQSWAAAAPSMLSHRAPRRPGGPLAAESRRAAAGLHGDEGAQGHAGLHPLLQRRSSHPAQLRVEGVLVVAALAADFGHGDADLLGGTPAVGRDHAEIAEALRRGHREIPQTEAGALVGASHPELQHPRGQLHLQEAGQGVGRVHRAETGLDDLHHPPSQVPPRPLPAGHRLAQGLVQAGRHPLLLEGGGAEKEGGQGASKERTILAGRSGAGLSAASSKARWISAKGRMWLTRPDRSRRPSSIQVRALA